MAYLNWISDSDLEKEVLNLLSIAKEALSVAADDLNTNVVDPFAIFFEMAGFNHATIQAWETSEKSRQAQKTLSNNFGIFHQNILGHAQDWVDLGTGNSADLECDSKKIIAELKNKYNTVKGSDLCNVYLHLEELIMPITSRYRGWTAYYVETIPRPSRGAPSAYNKPFTPSNRSTKTRCRTNEKIRIIDGASFYHMVTGEKHALIDLYRQLPNALENLVSRAISYDDRDKMIKYFRKAIPNAL